MAKKAKKKKSTGRGKAKRPAKKNTSSRPRAKKRPAKKNAHHKKKSAPRRPNPTRQLQNKIGQMVPGRFYDSTLSGAKVRIKRVGQSLVIRPKAKRK